MISGTDSFWYTCTLVFKYCISVWGITYGQLAEVVDKYKLASYIEKHEDEFDDLGPKGIVEQIERFITKNGGSIPNGTR